MNPFISTWTSVRVKWFDGGDSSLNARPIIPTITTFKVKGRAHAFIGSLPGNLKLTPGGGFYSDTREAAHRVLLRGLARTGSPSATHTSGARVLKGFVPSTLCTSPAAGAVGRGQLAGFRSRTGTGSPLF